MARWHYRITYQPNTAQRGYTFELAENEFEAVVLVYRHCRVYHIHKVEQWFGYTSEDMKKARWRELWCEALLNMPATEGTSRAQMLRACLNIRRTENVYKGIQSGSRPRNKKKAQHLETLAGPNGAFIARVQLVNLGYLKAKAS